MPTDQLIISLVQPDIIWEDKAANLEQYEKYIKQIEGPREVVVLPEMFSTGFSMNPEGLAERMDGRTIGWMKEISKKYRCILTGSIIIEEDGNYYNRAVWVQPDGGYGIYDKRHLFAYAGEDEHYTAGNKRLIVSVKGWRINIQVCYDLRFPVWARQSPLPQTNGYTGMPEYDVLLYMANWPVRRSLAWRTLLQARAIENQAYVVGVNRTGMDGKGVEHGGESSVFDPLGEKVWQAGAEATVQTVVLTSKALLTTRADLPFLKDADKFMLL